MKGARLIIPGCTGFFTPEPDAFGELSVIAVEHYKVKCLTSAGEIIFVPIREFEVLSWPTDGSVQDDPMN